MPRAEVVTGWTAREAAEKCGLAALDIKLTPDELAQLDALGTQPVGARCWAPAGGLGYVG
jgi:hypothetical protein